MQPRNRSFRGLPSFRPNRRAASLPNAAIGCRLAAEALGRNLKRELARLEHGLSTGTDIKPVFDRVYVPAATALSESLAGLHISEVEMLRLPLCPELAATQIRIFLQILSGVTKVLEAL